MEKPQSPNWIKPQNTEYRNTTNPSTMKQILTHEAKINIELIKKIMTEKKTTLPSIRNQDWKKCQGRNQKGKQIINKYPNRQHYWTEQANLCRGKTSLW